MYAELQGRIYANDPDFDQLRGRLVQRNEVTGITRDGWVVRHCVEVIDFGKPPRVTVDPDALLGDGLDLDGKPPRTRTAQGRTLKLLNEIYALLHTRPMNAREIAHATGQTVTRIKNILRDHNGGMEVLSRGTWGNVYGLAGRDYDVLHGAAMRRIVAYLREHGPTPAPALYGALGMHKVTFQRAVSAQPEVLRQVGTVAARGSGGAPAIVWDVAGDGHGND